MDDKQVTTGLALLAEEADTPPIDLYSVIATAKARTRTRRATVAAVFGTVVVAGTMVATIAFNGGTAGPAVGSQRPTSTSSAPPETGPTKAVNDDHMVRLTEQLADAWPAIAPPGVTAEASTASDSAQRPLAALEFGGLRYTWRPQDIEYLAFAKLSDTQGATELRVVLFPPGDNNPGPSPCQPESDCVSQGLPDGTQVQLRIESAPIVNDKQTGGKRNIMEARRPDGTTFEVSEQNVTVDGGSSLTRPDTILSTEAMLKFATALSYS